MVVSAESARGIIAEEQLRPERQGVFGLLSVGFVAAAALTVLGFLVYAIVSFQRRFIELGMLRAIGLSVGQMSAYLSAEQAFIVISGMGLGTLIGVAASTLFIPFLQVGLGSAAQVPPFIVKIALGSTSDHLRHLRRHVRRRRRHSHYPAAAHEGLRSCKIGRGGLV